MEKRGQFFVFGAIILCIAIFVLVTKVNTYEEKILLEDFPDLTENYKTESVKVVNDALLNNLDPSLKLDDFTDQFVNYARTISPNLGFVYAYKNPSGGVVVVNYNKDAILDVYAETSDTLYASNTESINEVDMDINGFSFKKTVPVKLTSFDKSYNQYVGSSNFITLGIGGILYPIDLTGTSSFKIISIDSITGETRVDVL